MKIDFGRCLSTSANEVSAPSRRGPAPGRANRNNPPAPRRRAACGLSPAIAKADETKGSKQRTGAEPLGGDGLHDFRANPKPAGLGPSAIGTAPAENRDRDIFHQRVKLKPRRAPRQSPRNRALRRAAVVFFFFALLRLRSQRWGDRERLPFFSFARLGGPPRR